ncbi:decapping and exoribonuclease protein-like [Dreissena polymorpha]|uniref:Decapping nuclease n=1 Tax=Dreissena polymorpha TaxID=45954 RepID=A0A9D4RB91_DREPO|nr:decapping and exoribonuclease protein-like [Dreissena polymorpha]KAH3861118.1 hypothetical protein DPMN_024046 [Dreissena polymorpha]
MAGVSNETHRLAPFLTKDFRQFDLKFPHFRQPEEIGYFSLDINREFSISKQQLKYFIKPSDLNNVCFDLKKRYSDMVKKDESKSEKIDNLLKWINGNRDKFVLKASKELVADDISSNRDLHTDFICWRGLLTKILCTPYENRDDWKIAVTRYNGTYYLCEYNTEAKIAQTAKLTERDKEICCWGWKFEQYLTADTKDAKPNTDTPFNNCEEFGTVVRSRLNSHSLVFAGEVDAIDTTGKKPHYVEFKTTRDFTHQKQLISFKRFKLIKWWAQSFLIGIPEVICGYRDDDGVVHRLESFNTNTIPSMTKDLYNPWLPNVCFNFLDQFLSFIKDTVTEDDYRLVHLLEWMPGKDVLCTRLGRDSQYQFLPDWYTNQQEPAIKHTV